jgi:hypothetical protein
LGDQGKDRQGPHDQLALGEFPAEGAALRGYH